MVEGLVFRGRGENMKVQEVGSLSIVLPSPPIPPRASRLACITAAILAFLIGVAVGVTLPLVLSKSSLTTPLSFALPQQQLQTSTSSSYTRRHENAIDIQNKGDVVINSIEGDSWQKLKAPLHTWSPTVFNGANESLSEGMGDMPPEHDAPDVREAPSLLVQGIYWGDMVENSLPKGFLDVEVDSWRKFTRRQAVVRLEEGCGRMQNRLITFANGTQSCCRYRQNYDQIQGEIFSFYLSRLLGLTNVPPSALGIIRAGNWQWSNVGNQLALAQWAEERPVVMTRYVNNLTSAFIPSSLRSSRRRLHPYQVEEIDPRDIRTMTELAQWSDLIIFDYLTGNLDRVVNNLYNMQWNPTMMEAPAHNLAHHKESGLLVFLDNESGLLHGYRLLDKYESFHAMLLQALCVFRQPTANRVKQLVSSGDVGDRLRKMFRRNEPDLQDFLPAIPDKSVKILNERLRSVHKQITKCEEMYKNS
ncbi:extracellular serine/threonine protein kinase four-jointed [Palaemon carinicauda]|uniref:extracellular serine/threonine protein kinase four-jointed n=1 Tax=Palaemon carinicauda TaxID=392227 RepID=UPI0035B5E5B2